MSLEYAWAQPLWESASTVRTTATFSADFTPEAAPVSLPEQPAEQILAALDVLPERLQLGQSVYVRGCATCHIAPSPAVLPTQTWARLLVSPQHYGTQIEVMRSPAIDLVWDYVQFASRSIAENETPPEQIRDSRFFRALHPRVEVERVNLAGCVSCHPNVWDYDYRTLSPEWLDAP